MNVKLKTDKQEYPVLGFSMSLVLHALIITAAAFIMHSSFEESRAGSPYVQIRTIETPPGTENAVTKEKTETVKKEQAETKIPAKEKKETPEKESADNTATASFYDFSGAAADTSSLDQIYSESTLDVRIKYPAGWTYIDQNVKSKLDGVTFWTTSANFNPPPYIHIEVKDKDLFNPVRFKHSYKTRNYTAYYNEPEELEGQIRQIIYIRTNTEKDFSLKLIMKGREAFREFQPVFFGMVKSFKYGNQFF
jgi:hypothetical protein